MPALKNKKHEAFARAVGVKGMSATEAYKSVWPNAAQRTAEVEGSKLSLKPENAMRIQEHREEAARRAAERDFLTVEEKRRFCARVVRAHGKDLDADGEDADLINGAKYDKFGNLVLEIPDKLKAIQLDNDLAIDGAEAGANKALEIIIRKL